MTGPAAVDALRYDIALGCRILARAGLAEDVLGHVSARMPDGGILVRCRGPLESGLIRTMPDDVRAVTADGQFDGEHVPPNELPIHVAMLERRDDINAVVHAHPPAVIVADLAGVPFEPLFGAYCIPAARMAAAGIPVYPRSVLISRRELAEEMADCMTDAPACILRGHGITTVGRTIKEAVAHALSIDVLARMAVAVVEAGGRVERIPGADLAELPDLGADFNTEMMWRFHTQRLIDEGHGIDDETEG